MTLNIPRTDRKRVVVVGGGFAGLQLVKKLSKSDYQVVLVDRNNFHMFQPLLYQVATAAINPGDIAFPFRKLLRGRKGVFFRMAEVQRVDTRGNVIYTDRGCLEYDYLVMASGSTTNYFGMDNIENHSYAMKEVSEALAIRNRVLLHIEKAVELADSDAKRAMLNIVIVGGGATGVELAGAFAEMKHNIMPKDYPEYHRGDINIYLIEGAGKLIGTMSEKTSARTLEILGDMGVEVLLNSTVVDYDDNSVVLRDGRRIPTRNLIWTSGVTVGMPEGFEQFPRGRGNRLLTDMYFRVKGSDNIFAVGDASIQSDDPDNANGYPQLARVAMEQASHLGRNFRRLARGKLPEPFRYVEYPVMATVGRNRAFAEYGRLRVGGFFAWLAWAGVHLFLILGVKNKLNVFWGWFWNYMTYDLPTRVVILPHGKPGLSDRAIGSGRAAAGQDKQAPEGPSAREKAAELPATVRHTENDLPATVRSTDKDLPATVRNTAADLPATVLNTENDLPVPIHHTGNDLPAMVDHTGNGLPAMVENPVENLSEKQKVTAADTGSQPLHTRSAATEEGDGTSALGDSTRTDITKTTVGKTGASPTHDPLEQAAPSAIPRSDRPKAGKGTATPTVIMPEKPAKKGKTCTPRTPAGAKGKSKPVGSRKAKPAPKKEKELA